MTTETVAVTAEVQLSANVTVDVDLHQLQLDYRGAIEHAVLEAFNAGTVTSTDVFDLAIDRGSIEQYESYEDYEDVE